MNAFLMGFSINAHYPIALAMIGITVANLLSRRLDRDRSRYFAETLAMWGLYGLSWTLTYGRVTDNLVKWVLLWTSLAFIGGWRLLRAPSGGGELPLLAPLTAEEPPHRSDNIGTMSRTRIGGARAARAYAFRLRHA
jgi:hypothetical protein